MSTADVLDLGGRRARQAGAAIADLGEPWWEDAVCRDETAALFFSNRLSDIARAKRMCATCPVMAPCLEGALLRREPWGVWGGQLLVNGRIQTTKRRRGRPSKAARPEDQLPQIPIPARLRPLIVVQAS